jgi:phenylacetate-CoA ligase
VIAEPAATPDPGSRYLDPAIETMARPELEALQTERLLERLPQVYEHSALMRSVWQAAGISWRDITSLEEFSKLAPFVDKDRIRQFRADHADPVGGLLCVPHAHIAVLGSSSGTSGDPTPLPQQANGPLVVGLARDFWEAGARPGDYVANAQFTYRSSHAIERFERIPVVPIFLDQGTEDLEALFDASVRFRPTVLYVVNNLLIAAIDDYGTRSGRDPAEVLASYKAVIFGGEPLSDRSRALLARWGLRAPQMTALGDVCGAIECREADGCHTWEDLALVEHLQLDSTTPAADGERGELVVTSLTEWVAPLIRFRSGDIVELTRRPCGCGRTHARIKVLGRTGDEIVIDGRSILPRDVWPAIEAVPATAAGLFQLIRRERHSDRLRIRVGYRGTSMAAGLAADVASSVEDRLGLVPEVELVPEAQLLRLGPPHKIPRVSAV